LYEETLPTETAYCLALDKETLPTETAASWADAARKMGMGRTIAELGVVCDSNLPLTHELP